MIELSVSACEWRGCSMELLISCQSEGILTAVKCKYGTANVWMSHLNCVFHGRITTSALCVLWLIVLRSFQHLLSLPVHELKALISISCRQRTSPFIRMRFSDLLSITRCTYCVWSRCRRQAGASRCLTPCEILIGAFSAAGLLCLIWSIRDLSWSGHLIFPPAGWNFKRRDES